MVFDVAEHLDDLFQRVRLSAIHFGKCRPVCIAQRNARRHARKDHNQRLAQGAEAGRVRDVCSTRT